MVRFFFYLIFCFMYFSSAPADQLNWPNFKKEHVDPFFQKGTDSTSGWIWASGITGVAIAREDDDRVRDYWRDHQQMNTAQAHVGDLMGTGAFSFLVAGLQYKLDDREHAYQSHLRGIAYGGMSIYAMKTMFNRKRPGTSRNYQSFPSGHSAIMFMTASHVWLAYDWKWGAAAGALAAFTAASRLSDDVHWYSDVIGGAFLGAWVGRASYYNFSEMNKVEDNAATFHYDWFPIVSSQQYGIVAQLRF